MSVHVWSLSRPAALAAALTLASLLLGVALLHAGTTEKKLTASDAEAGDWFGWSVAVSGDTAVVGSFFEDGEGVSRGAAYVFGRDQGGAGAWGQVTKLIALDGKDADDFGQSVAVSGNIAVVGASTAAASSGAFSFEGAAYVFQGGAGTWGQVGRLAAVDAEAVDRFGISVAVSGDTVVVGAYLEDAGGDAAGAAYVFGRDQGGAGNWGQVAKLAASDAQAGDWFGISVAVSGDTAVVGAINEDVGGSDAGAAYVFQRDQGGAGNWGQVAKLTASDARDYDWFGQSVAVSGDTVVVGAENAAAGNVFGAGAAYVFQRDEGGAGNWGQVKKLSASDAHLFDAFGHSVAVSGDTAIVGAFFAEAGGVDAGAAYVFRRDQGGADNWGQAEKLTAFDAQYNDRFGASVAVSGDTAVMGAHLESAFGSEAGAAYISTLAIDTTASTPTPTPTPAVALAFPAPPAGGMTQGLSGTTDIQALIAAQTFTVESVWLLDVATQAFLVYIPGAPSFVQTLTVLAASDIVTIKSE